METLQLIALYYHICDCYDKQLAHQCQRFSNNSTEPDFTDEELLTVYLFVMLEEEKYKGAAAQCRLVKVYIARR